jgi:hypothetical protein
MKADRRHELQQNELADWLGEKIDALKPYATQITVGVAALLLLIVAGSWWLSGEDKLAARNWSDYVTALNLPRDSDKALEKLALDKPGSTTALWAKMSLADASAGLGGRAMFTDRTEAQKQLTKAEAAYKEVAAAAQDPLLKSRAQYGLGKVYESLCKPQEAAKYYDMAAATQKDTAIGKAAAADAQRMKRQSQVDLLAWFAGQTPKRPAPIPGFGGSIPGLPGDLPSRPDISVPGISPSGGLGLDNIGTGVPATPGPEFPAPAKAEEPRTEEPKNQEPKGEEPKAKAEESKTEPKTEAPKTEEPETEAPKADPA